MEWSPEGAYQPVDGGKCLPKCRRCLDVCPFVDRPEDEDSLGAELFGGVPGIGHAPEVGFHLGAYVGSAGAGHRERGASGGLASYVLASLLERGEVDRVLCVRPNRDPDRLFSYAVLDSPEAVRGAAKSAYFPVEISAALQTVRAEEGRYAVIGLPCVVKGVRLAMRADRRLRERITVVAGLVCGQTKGRGFTDYLVRSMGLDPRAVDRASFRGKDPAKPASNHLFTAEAGGESRTTEWEGFYGRAWHSGEFSLNACSYCDDVFAETADIVFMDAWLPEYVRDGRGTSIAIAKTPRMAALLEDGSARGDLSLTPLPIDQAIASQSGALAWKRTLLPYRLWLWRGSGEAPRKRQPARRPSLWLRLRLQARERVRLASHRAACMLRAEEGGYEEAVGPARRRLAAMDAAEKRFRSLLNALRR